MSLNRFNPRRDENEPEVRARFASHGWHTEQLSGTGMPDLLVWPHAKRLQTLAGEPAPGAGLRLSAFVDVKMPGKKATKAQVEKWTALSAKGIPVYVASTEADVDAIVGGTATPWWPPSVSKMKGGRSRRVQERLGQGMSVHAAYNPPRSTPVDAPALAAETFAPTLCAVPACPLDAPCPRHSLSALGRK